MPGQKSKIFTLRYMRKQSLNKLMRAWIYKLTRRWCFFSATTFKWNPGSSQNVYLWPSTETEAPDDRRFRWLFRRPPEWLLATLMMEKGNSEGRGGPNGGNLELHNLCKVRRTQTPKIVGKLVQKLLIFLGLNVFSQWKWIIMKIHLSRNAWHK